jgi:hypothetical protein
VNVLLKPISHYKAPFAFNLGGKNLGNSMINHTPDGTYGSAVETFTLNL